MNIVILTGAPAPGQARADEADTQVQARFVAEHLSRHGCRVTQLTMGLDLEAARRALTGRAPELVFNLVESMDGCGEWVHLGPAMLDHLGLAYTGCGRDAMYLTSNKPLARRVLATAGLPVPAAWPPDAGAAPGRWIVKSAWEHASLGLDRHSVVDAANVEAKLAQRRAEHGGEWYAEAFVAGREFNLALLEGPGGPVVLPPAEIDFSAFPAHLPRIVDYAAKWDEDSFQYHNTPRRFEFNPSDGALLEELQRLALQCWKLFGLRGYARVDFRVDAAGRPFILEVNANPCLSPDAGFMAAADRAGLGASDAIRRIVAAALPLADDTETSACS